LATHPSHATTVNVARPELLVYGVRSARDLKPLIERASVIALGPGLSQEPWARPLWRSAVAADRSLVIDADALNLLARSPQKKEHWILTPHPGEAARLLTTETNTIQRDRFAAARAIVERFGGVCVLKGAGTLVAATDSMWLCDRGNPGMASAGMGDVLTGVIAALCAQGLAPIDAARLGVWLHATAGDDAAGGAPIGLIASDLNDYLRRRLNRLANDDTAI
jgi:NAD(P)H-hydrate epimerase